MAKEEMLTGGAVILAGDVYRNLVKAIRIHLGIEVGDIKALTETIKRDMSWLGNSLMELAPGLLENEEKLAADESSISVASFKIDKSEAKFTMPILDNGALELLKFRDGADGSSITVTIEVFKLDNRLVTEAEIKFRTDKVNVRKLNFGCGMQ